MIDAETVNWDAWMDMWATDYVTVKLDPTIENYRIFFDGLDLPTNYLVTTAWKENGVIFRGSFSLDAQKDGYMDWPYNPTIGNLTLIISNVGNTTT